MKLTYKMTADEFYKGYNYKIQKIGLNNMAEIVSLVVIMIASIIVSVLGIVNATVILPFENTIRLYDEGLEIFSSFEKVYAPWQSIYAIKETKSELIILPTLSRGIAVISKQRYGKELDEIIKVLKSKGVMK